MRDPRYDVLFEPVRIGPRIAKNRFYQVPHCNGMGWRDPTALAEMRGIKAEGGWAVICTEEVEIHPTADVSPFAEGRLWDARDIPALARMVERVQAHGALAGIELCHNALFAANLWSREVALAPSSLPNGNPAAGPVQARAMDLEDIRNMRRWHVEAAERAIEAGFDLVYVYAGHHLTVLSHFLSRRWNQRTDEYGGPLVNRVRLLREVLEETLEAVGGRAAVPLRISASEMMGPDGLEPAEFEDVVGMLAELPDLWDICLAGWEWDSQTARFSEEGFQEPFFASVKRLTTKPVVGVGRYTSPDRMVSLVRKGLLDMIGAARPSIADPFLPRKIEEGRVEDIRECIGCNICVSGDYLMTPIRCTQNPSMGDEWRRGWHPERIRPKGSDAAVLVVGAGPAGLEAAMMLGRRGYRVTLAERLRAPGGRVAREAGMPGLNAWGRVRDYRVGQIAKLEGVELFLESDMTAETVLELGAAHVCLATGARWRADGVGRSRIRPVPVAEGARVMTPDDILGGAMPPPGPVLIWDDDHYYMGSVIAEKLAAAGHEVTLATPEADVAHWAHYTMEQAFVQTRLMRAGVRLVPHHDVAAVAPGTVRLAEVHTGEEREIAAATFIPVTARLPVDGLFRDLAARRADWEAAGLRSVRVIGDAEAPGMIAHAVHAGRRYAEELDGAPVTPRREIIALAPR